jgi:hypothetical protein
MKDIQKLKLWPLLEKEGFTLKEYRMGGILYGRGAILMPDMKTGFPFIEIKPIPNGRWKLTVDLYNTADSIEDTPFEIGKILPEKLLKFRNHNPQ